MKLNAHLALVDSHVALVPYRPEHVATYHRWMQDPVLRALTASEPLSLAQEHAMQQQWQHDDDKLTFIVLARDPAHADAAPLAALPMVGDVNLFLKGTPGADGFEAEVEVMIAEPAYRRRGLAQHALTLLLAFATSPPPPPPPAADPAHPAPFPIAPQTLVARIGAANAPSIALFARLGFEVVRAVPVFAEVEMRVRARARGWVGGAVVPYP